MSAIEKPSTPAKAAASAAGVGSLAAVPEAVGRGKLDFGLLYAPDAVTAIDAGEPIAVLAGIHVGCYELFAREGIRAVADLKGKSVGVQTRGGALARARDSHGRRGRP